MITILFPYAISPSRSHHAAHRWSNRSLKGDSRRTSPPPTPTPHPFLTSRSQNTSATYWQPEVWHITTPTARQLDERSKATRQRRRSGQRRAFGGGSVGPRVGRSAGDGAPVGRRRRRPSADKVCTSIIISWATTTGVRSKRKRRGVGRGGEDEGRRKGGRWREKSCAAERDGIQLLDWEREDRNAKEQMGNEGMFGNQSIKAKRDGQRTLLRGEIRLDWPYEKV